MSKFENLTARSRYFRCLLYPDNPLHAAAMDMIPQYADEYIGIVHTEQDGEKEHKHFVLFFDNPRVTATVCKALGFVDPTGLPDDQFVRAIVKNQKRKVDQQLKDCCVYLTHRNAPEKEQYPTTLLFGAKDRIAWTAKQVMKYESQEFDMSDCVSAVLDWIARQDDFIRVYSFGKWLCNSPYFKANNNKIIWAAIREHNLRIYNEKCDSVMPTGGFDSIYPDFREITDEELAGMRFVYGGD